jgi:hypothetical protein
LEVALSEWKDDHVIFTGEIAYDRDILPAFPARPHVPRSQKLGRKLIQELTDLDAELEEILDESEDFIGTVRA